MRSLPALTLAALAASAGPAPAGGRGPADPGVCGAVIGGLVAGGPGSAVGASWAQPQAPDVAAQLYAVPPDRAALDRLRLAQEWYAYVPLLGQKDSIALVQVIDAELIVAQTRSGLVVGLDARTGAKQWTHRLPSPYVAAYPVSVAGRFVFVANLATLVCLDRLTGQVEFTQNLTGSLSAGPTAAVVPVYGVRDNQTVAIGERAVVFASVNANRIVSFPVPDAGRVAVTAPPPPPLPPVPQPAPLPPPDTVAGDAGRNRTPSITILPQIVPPYTLYGRQTRLTPSLSTLPSLSAPYTLNPEFLRYNQRTPSVGVLPPSVARAYELANLRAKAPDLTPNWVHGSTRRLGYEPIVSVAVPGVAGARVFATTTGPHVTALTADAGRVQLDFDLEAPIVAPAAGPVAVGDLEFGVYALEDGAVVALDLTHGNRDAPAVAWRTVVGGVRNQKPVLTADAVYVAGDGAGVAKLDLRTGEVLWRTDGRADRVLAVAEQFVFARGRLGETLVYPRTAPPGPAVPPLAVLPPAGYDVAVTNAATDRLILAADNGLVVSLRDALPRAIRPTLNTPPSVAAPRNPNPPVVNPDSPPPADPMPKK
jgi:outer membrane protein assembly factor BamB